MHIHTYILTHTCTHTHTHTHVHTHMYTHLKPKGATRNNKGYYSMIKWSVIHENILT